MSRNFPAPVWFSGGVGGSVLSQKNVKNMNSNTVLKKGYEAFWKLSKYTRGYGQHHSADLMAVMIAFDMRPQIRLSKNQTIVFNNGKVTTNNNLPKYERKYLILDAVNNNDWNSLNALVGEIDKWIK